MVMWAGSAVGVLIGLAHAAYVYRIVAIGTPADMGPNHARGVCYAIWTVLLWALFGSYIVVLWLVGIVLYLVFKAFR
jgi:hypothetical protein